MPIGIPGGPFVSAKWGGLALHPKEDSSPEIELGGRDYEMKITGDGEPYSEAESVVGSIKSEYIMTADEYKQLKAMQDGKPRAGTFTTSNGDVYSANGAISGECKLNNGVVDLTIAGKVRLQ